MDRAWFLFLNGLPAHVPALGAVAAALAGYGLLCYAAMLVWLWVRGAPSDATRRTLLLGVLAAALSLAVNFGLNLAVPRPRPFLALPAHVLVTAPRDPSFPSDHAAMAAAIATTLLLGGTSRWGAAALLGALVIGASRVLAGVHYPSDILGGMLVGAACAAASLGAQRPLRPALDRALAAARRLRLA